MMYEPEDTGSIEEGQVGWGDDPVYYDLGQNTGNPEDALTLVRVTMLMGRDISKPLDTKAQGFRALCRIGGGLHRVPPKGTRVIVAFPAGMRGTAGGGVIISTIEDSPTIQFSDTKAKLDLGPDVDLVIKARSVTISDYGNRFMGIGEQGGVQFWDETGSGLQVKDGNIAALGSGFIGLTVQSGGDVKAAMKLTSSESSIMNSGGSVLKLKGSEISVGGGMASVACTLVNIGIGASPANFAVTSVGGVPTPSARVWIAP